MTDTVKSSSTEAGVLVAITGYGPPPPVGGTYYHWREATRSPQLLYPRGSETSLTYPEASDPRTPWGSCMLVKMEFCNRFFTHFLMC
ncbi:hypothetical protein AVEN_74700-1 [Araneus ventricosus]|uniref:Uncharacterized protein n=1 Tax=Araneus ventricosus TaxID=182803 RepID=A0A4Y2GCI5_ARAVE|nr:hypothetical protein AVEN_74700-1 [Araneus ventricosus]